MKVRRYEDSDFSQISEWAKDYDTQYEQTQFPKIGFIVDGFAAYFIYQTDSSICFLENLISNKNADRTEKEKAIELVIQAILQEASDLGFRVAYATTDMPQVIVRAISHGARMKAKQALLIKNLTDPSSL